MNFLLRFSLHLFVAVYFLLHVLDLSLMNNPRFFHCTGLKLFTFYFMFGVVVWRMFLFVFHCTCLWLFTFCCMYLVGVWWIILGLFIVQVCDCLLSTSCSGLSLDECSSLFFIEPICVPHCFSSNMFTVVYTPLLLINISQ